MASIQTNPSGTYQVIFYFSGQRYKRSLKTKKEQSAIARRQAVQETIDLIDNGRLPVPEDVDPVAFILAEGRLPKLNKKAPSASAPNGQTNAPPELTLQSLFTRFFDSIPDGNLESSTLATMHRHERHLLRILKASFPVKSLKQIHLQEYVNKRAKEKTQFCVEKGANGNSPTRTTVGAKTIKKELVTLGTAWRWAETNELVIGSFPGRDLRLPKTRQLAPFQTWDEIERQIQLNEFTGRKADFLWDALYLRRSEIDQLLDHVNSVALYPFIHPMFVMAAQTGARRSELLRSQKADFDFDADVVTIRERKRVRGEVTTRRVDLSPTLRFTMLEWFDKHHPGGPWTFCYTTPVRRSRTRTPAGSPITCDQAHDHFQRTLSNSRWSKIKGWHCLRHSFISNLACAAVDQRIIDEFVGHTTEQMRRRYRHLFPDVKKAAINKVFG